MRIFLAALAIVLSSSAAHAGLISWTFQGNFVSPGSPPDLAGDVTITLDDENTAGSVKLSIDASGLGAGEFIRNVYFTTVFNVDIAPPLAFTPPAAFPSYFSYTPDEDQFQPLANVVADVRLSFNGSGSLFDNTAGLFEGTFSRTGLLASDFLTNDGGAPYEISLQAQGLSGPFGNFFFGERVVSVPEPASLPLLAGGLLGIFVLRNRKRKNA